MIASKSPMSPEAGPATGTHAVELAEHAGARVQLVDYREDPHSGVT